MRNRLRRIGPSNGFKLDLIDGRIAIPPGALHGCEALQC